MGMNTRRFGRTGHDVREIGREQLDAILDYEQWDSIRQGQASSIGDGSFRFGVEQVVSLTNNPFAGAISSSKTLKLSGENYLDEHYSLYMDDAGW